MYNVLVPKQEVSDNSVITGQLDNIKFNHIMITVKQTPNASNPVNASKEDFDKILVNLKLVNKQNQTVNLIENVPLSTLIDHTDVLEGLGSENGDITYFISRTSFGKIELGGERQLKIELSVGALKGSTINSTIKIKSTAVFDNDADVYHALTYQQRSITGGADTNFANVVQLVVIGEGKESINDTIITFQDGSQLRPSHEDAFDYTMSLARVSNDLPYAMIFSSKDYPSGEVFGKNINVRPTSTTKYFCISAVA